MTSTQSYQEIPEFIMVDAARFADMIDLRLRLYRRDQEDIFHELVRSGYESLAKYSSGTASEHTYVYRVMQLCASQIISRYNRNCRKTFLFEEQYPEDEEYGNRTVTPTSDSGYFPDIVGKVHVRDILSRFSRLQRKIAELAMEGNSCSEIVAELGISTAAVNSQKRKMRKIVKNLHSGCPDSGKDG